MTNFKKKYLKYKMKYLLLKGGSRLSFKTISNSGSLEGIYSNQCLWISILDYLKNVKNYYDLTLNELRLIASGESYEPVDQEIEEINKPNSIFDFFKHKRSLDRVIETFDLHIVFYQTVNESGSIKLDNNSSFSYGNIESPNILNIICYGNHFELITNINGIDLYENARSAHVFEPDIKLSLGISDSINQENIQRINLLIQENDLNLKNFLENENIIKKLIIELEEIEGLNASLSKNKEDNILIISQNEERIKFLNTELPKMIEINEITKKQFKDNEIKINDLLK